MLLPMREVSLPAALVGQPNGQLPVSLLKPTPGQARGPLIRLCDPATRAWRALCAAALKAGYALKATSAVDSYRPLSVQQSVFAQRYTTVPHEGWAQRTCKGVTYYQRPGTAAAACPATSNHGLGLAVDLANAVDPMLTWLVAHELAYGFSHELASEAWHIHYFTGDKIPAAVLAYEAATGGDMVDYTEAQMEAFPWKYQDAGQPSTHSLMVDPVGEYRTALREIQAKLDQIITTLDSSGGGALVAHTHDGGQTGPAEATL